MQVAKLLWTEAAGWGDPEGPSTGAQLVLYFGARRILASEAPYRDLKRMFPTAYVLGCSTGGQIFGDDISDDTIAAVALRFEATQLRLAAEPLAGAEDSRPCGERIGRRLRGEGLSGLFVLSDGLNVNGSELVAGITASVGPNVPISGGLAGDGAQFEETLVGADCPPTSRLAAAVGFYGPRIRIGHGSAGGWDVFGPRRQVTRSSGNVLFELDGEPALDLYERYLGEDDAKGLPGTALLFPLQIFNPDRPDHVVMRTILAVDRQARSMTFAGDVPQGWMAQLMRGNFERLAGGSGEAARQAHQRVRGVKGDGVAVLVSCIGRRLLMGQRVVDEVESAGAELDTGLSRLGFYSYGEISPHAVSGCCELHNQTMTVTTIREAA
jgi:hypothetical protein